MLEKILQPASLIKLSDPLLARSGAEVWIKREDLLHPIISGNKWRKLKYIMQDATARGCRRIVSMGGPYSNHLHALAYAGKLLGLETVGLIRGEPPGTLTPTLVDLRRWGMELEFVSRPAFRELRKHRHWDSEPGRRYGGYWVAEGGAGPLALKGVAEMIAEIDIPFDTLALACGTGTTLAGCVAALPAASKALGVATLKGAGFLENEVEDMLHQGGITQRCDYRIELDYHFGGFGRSRPELDDFVAGFGRRNGIALEPIYTGKLFFALYDLIGHGRFPEGHRIVAVHTGGLQGKRTISTEAAPAAGMTCAPGFSPGAIDDGQKTQWTVQPGPS